LNQGFQAFFVNAHKNRFSPESEILLPGDEELGLMGVVILQLV
jgi:hypothetical protein